MKISKNNMIIVILLACLVQTACNDWLDVTPEVNIKDEDLFKTEDGYFDALVGSYALVTSSALYGDKLSLSFLDVLASNYTIDDKSLKSFYYASRYDYLNTNTRIIIDAIWGGDMNYALIKGEALALRAFLHFDLARMFGPVPLENKDKEFMPYVKEIGKENTPYSTLAEVLNLVLADLRTAEMLLEKDPITDHNFTTNSIYLMSRKDRLNYYAVQALMARVYLYQGDTRNARFYAEKVIEGQNSATLLSSTVDLDKDRLFSQELLFALFVDNIGEISDGYYLPKAGEEGELKLEEKKLKEVFEFGKYDKKDARYAYLFEDMEGYPRLIKYRQLSTDSPAGRYRVPMLKMAEMYYITAECSPTLDSAELRINQVRTARRLPSLEFHSMTEINDYLKQEYRREFTFGFLGL